MPRKKPKFRGKDSASQFHGKTHIPRLGSKFCSPRKTVGPTNLVKVSLSFVQILTSCLQNDIIAYR